MTAETYLGDGVYATFDGYHIWLDCRGQQSLGLSPSGSPGIALEPDVLSRLVEFQESCFQKESEHAS